MEKMTPQISILKLCIAIMVVGLATLFMANVFVGIRKRYTARAMEKEFSAIFQLCRAVDDYRTDTGEQPTAQQGLLAVTENSGVKGWKGPYLAVPAKHLDEGNILDAFGTPYRYSPSDDKYEIRSAGPDKKFDTKDDIAIRRP